jgi:hypothetical protein
MLQPDGPEWENVLRSIRLTLAARPFSPRSDKRWRVKKVPAGPAPTTPTEAPSRRGMPEDPI